jgi:hypothetical protein
MIKILLILFAVGVIVAAVFFLMMVKGPDVQKYEHLKDPKITTLPDILVLEVPFETSTEGLKDVFNFLFKTYFKIKGVSKKVSKMMPPVARYENNLDFAMEAEKRDHAFKNIIWKGAAAIPLKIKPDKLPELKHEKLKARLSHWQYGETAEILHIGPYEQEAPTVKKIREYIATQGYEITGLHE